MEEKIKELESILDKHFEDWFFRLTQAYYLMCKTNLEESDKNDWRPFFDEGMTIFEAIDSDEANA